MEYYRKLLFGIHEVMTDDTLSYMPLSEYNIYNVLGVKEKKVLCADF